MRCWNCNHEMPDTAKVCAHCEASMMPEISAEEMQMAAALLEQMPPELLAELRQAIGESSTAEDFANRIFVGDCPACSSSDTGNCESDPDIDDLLVGRCYDCGQLWCTECRRLLQRNAIPCPCLNEEELPDDLQ